MLQLNLLLETFYSYVYVERDERSPCVCSHSQNLSVANFAIKCKYNIFFIESNDFGQIE